MHMQRRSIILSILLLSTASSLPAQVAIKPDSVYSPSVHRTMKFNVLLPENYAVKNDRYVTLYLLHGFEGSYNDWVIRTRLVSLLSQYSLLVITPDAGNSWYVNSATDTNARYEDYILRDLIPYVDRTYRTISTRHGRMIAGLSMGGYGAMRFALKNPRYFCFAASFSGALYAPSARQDNKIIEASLLKAFGKPGGTSWQEGSVLSLADSASGGLPYLFLSTGNEDIRAIVDNNRLFIEKLRNRGITYEYHERPGKHTWLFWDREVEGILKRVAAFDPGHP